MGWTGMLRVGNCCRLGGVAFGRWILLWWSQRCGLGVTGIVDWDVQCLGGVMNWEVIGGILFGKCYYIYIYIYVCVCVCNIYNI